MIQDVVNCYAMSAAGPLIITAGTPVGTSGLGVANPTAATPVNPAHAIGDTLLCLCFARGNPTITVSGAGWVDATGITNPLDMTGNNCYLFMNECDSASEANCTLTPTSVANATLHAVILRIQNRTFGANFNWGTPAFSGSDTTTIKFLNNSPTIEDGNAIIANGIKFNDYLVGNATALTGATAGPTWAELVDTQSNIGNDTSWVVDWALNNTGSSYTTGTAGQISGFTLSVSAGSTAAYLEVCKT